MALNVRWRAVDDDGDAVMVSATLNTSDKNPVVLMGTTLVFRDPEGETLLLVPEGNLFDARYVEATV